MWSPARLGTRSVRPERPLTPAGSGSPDARAGASTITNDGGTWEGGCTGTTTWTVSEPEHKHDMDCTLVGAGGYEGLRFVVNIKGGTDRGRPRRARSNRPPPRPRPPRPGGCPCCPGRDHVTAGPAWFSAGHGQRFGEWPDLLAAGEASTGSSDGASPARTATGRPTLPRTARVPMSDRPLARRPRAEWGVSAGTVDPTRTQPVTATATVDGCAQSAPGIVTSMSTAPGESSRTSLAGPAGLVDGRRSVGDRRSDPDARGAGRDGRRCTGDARGARRWGAADQPGRRGARRRAAGRDRPHPRAPARDAAGPRPRPDCTPPSARARTRGTTC